MVMMMMMMMMMRFRCSSCCNSNKKTRIVPRSCRNRRPGGLLVFRQTSSPLQLLLLVLLLLLLDINLVSGNNNIIGGSSSSKNNNPFLPSSPLNILKNQKLGFRLHRRRITDRGGNSKPSYLISSGGAHVEEEDQQQQQRQEPQGSGSEINSLLEGGEGAGAGADTGEPTTTTETSVTASSSYSSIGEDHGASGTTTTAFVKKKNEQQEHRLPFLRRGCNTLKQHAESIGQHLDQLKNKALKGVGGPIGNNKMNGDASGANNRNELMRLLGSIMFGGAIWKGQNGIPSFPTMLALSLLGSSVGFYLFLYFISIGYALGIGLPLLVTLIKLQFFFRSSAAAAAAATTPHISLSTKLHTAMVLLWSARAICFFLWREYWSWPALHTKIKSVKSPPLTAQILCWFVYSFLYTCMISPCWFRLGRDAISGLGDAETAAAATSGGGLGGGGEVPLADIAAGGLFLKTVSRLGIGLQIFGLVLESVADYQKCIFKASYDPGLGGLSRRNQFCNVGVWDWSTNPNYLGELLFWVGTFLGGAQAIRSPIQFIMASAGLIFISLILRGATLYLTGKHNQKYSYLNEFLKFRATHGFWGPKSLKVWLSHLPQPTPALPAATKEEFMPLPEDEQIQAEI